MSRHARRDNSGRQDGEHGDDHVPLADDDPIVPGYGVPGWPQDDLTGQQPGDPSGAAAGRRHVRRDARTPDQAWSAGRPGAPDRIQPPGPPGPAGQPAEPFRWSPEPGGGGPDPYAWAPEPGSAGPGPGREVPGYRSGAGSYLDAPASYGDAPASYGGPPSSYGGAPASFGGAPAGYDAELPDRDAGRPGYGSAPASYGRGARLAPGSPVTTGPPWADDTMASPLPPLPSLPGTGHPSGPLPPLPPSELAWRQSLADPLLAEPGPDLGTPGGYADSTFGESGTAGQPGYQPYGDDPRDRRAGVAQEARGYPDAGGWYGNVEEPQVRVEDEDAFLPGLDGGRSGRRRAGSGSGSESSRRRRKRGRRAVMVAGMVMVLIVVAVLGVGYSYWRKYYMPPDFSGPGTGSVVVQIKPGDSATTVGQHLANIGVVDSARAFSIAAKNSRHGTALEPGYYHLHKHMKASLAFALLLKPSSRIQTKIAIPEGYRLSQIIATLGQKTGNLKGYQQAIAKTASLGLPAFANGNPEGYLFPATYPIQPNTPPLTVLRAMVARFDQEATSVNLPASAKRAQLSEADVITVASMIQAEGKRPQDLPKIARVIYNRLNMVPPMPLQLDTTVLYALHSFAGDVTIAQTKTKSAYNTYLHAGLPPGPIDSPGDLAIQAALHPAAGNWTYFLTVNPKTGLTLFTNSFATFQTFQAELARNTGNG